MEDSYYHKLKEYFGVRYHACQKQSIVYWVCSKGFDEFYKADRYSREHHTKLTGGLTTIHTVCGFWPYFIKKEILSYKLKTIVKFEEED